MIVTYLLTGEWTTSCFFLIEIFLCDITLVFDKRKTSPLRMTLGLLLLFAMIFFFPHMLPLDIIEHHFILAKTYEILVLIIYFLMISLISRIIFRISNSKCLFCVIASYAIQNSFYCISNILFTAFGNFLPVYVHELICLCSLYLVCLIFRKALKKIGFIEMDNKSLLLILGIVIFVNSIIGVLSQEATTKKDIIIEKAYGLSVNIIVLYLQFSILKKQTYQRKYYMSKILWEKDKKNYELKKESIEDMNQKVHDLKHILNSIQNKMDSKEFNDFRDSINKYENLTQTGSLPVDVVLADKWEFAKKKNIKLTFLGDASQLSFMEEAEIYSLFVNILDNAFDAVLQLEDVRKRVISMILTEKENMILIQCSNYTSNQPVFNSEGLIKTSKENKALHGYGLKSIHAIAKKYNGYLSISSKDGLFVLKVLFNKA